MNNIVNLNKLRKGRARAEARQQAEENAAKFGRSKTQKALERARNAKANRDLDQTKRDI